MLQMKKSIETKIVNGYIWVNAPKHPFSKKGWILSHRLIVEEIIGRYLTKHEVVHHLDSNRQNNEPKNLMVFPNQKAHQEWHNKLKRYGYLTRPMLFQVSNHWKNLSSPCENSGLTSLSQENNERGEVIIKKEEISLYTCFGKGIWGAEE